MLDPISALAVATSAVQFIDFSSKLFSLIRDTYRSKSEENGWYKDLQAKASQMSTLNACLTETITPELLCRDLLPLESETVSIGKECQRVANQLSKELESITPTSADGFRTVVKRALKALWAQQDITQLQDRMAECRQALMMSILADIRQQLLQPKETTRPLHKNSRENWGGAQSLPEWLKHQKSHNAQWQSNLSEAVIHSSVTMVQEVDRAPKSVELLLPAWRDSLVTSTIGHKLFQKLHFDDMLHRTHQIPEAFAKTFEWIFHEPSIDDEEVVGWDNFRSWLKGDSDTYWITGKAGSGKSTLMKMIFYDSRTPDLLNAWSGSSPLIMASFFFWNSGSKLQMSREGFLRSILHQAIDRRRQHFLTTEPTKLDAFGLSVDSSDDRREKKWKWSDLTQALRLLIEEEGPEPVHYAFFIDGLDEFSGDKSDLLSLFKTLGAYPNVKLCISSRPWVEFEDAFKQKPNLMLQYRTMADIRHYVGRKFDDHPGFRELQLGDQQYAVALIDSITAKASGVFLWVVLVVRSLLEGLAEGDRISDLQRRLEDIPPELDDLFKNMLGSLNPTHFKHSSELFQIFRATRRKISVLTMSFADEQDTQYAFHRVSGPLSEEETYYRVVSMCRRLKSRCKGLLEVSSSTTRSSSLDHWSRLHADKEATELSDTDPESMLRPDAQAAYDSQKLRMRDYQNLANAPVEYLHRTVKDFMATPDIWNFITQATDSSFDAEACLSRSYILHLKTRPIDAVMITEAIFWDDVSWAMEYAASVAATNTEYHVKLLDELDKAATSLCTTPDKDGDTYLGKLELPLSSHWSAIISKASETDFIPFAVRCQLGAYVIAKLQDNPTTTENYTKLLSVAMHESGLPFLRREGKTPSPKLVDFLISKGADPNDATKDGSDGEHRSLYLLTSLNRSTDTIYDGETVVRNGERRIHGMLTSDFLETRDSPRNSPVDRRYFASPSLSQQNFKSEISSRTSRSFFPRRKKRDTGG
ncbi:hypothetical protein EJ04DRAFT_559668 [Polyplosphaeria fusca]|uniref:NACHT domain-containing protein n=1 Tax=Polyplosphaeria fusca TaxID=682080 RepID=A0A9P4V4P1_9PLEO|nr:hypothetical protein EJ04DRAFT_559668 [Polyplosphaeria fusca]